MPIISGHLKTMTTRTSAVAEVWVQSTEVMPRDKEVIVPETTKIPVDDGKVEFTAYPGRATIILVYMDSTPNAPIPIFITDEETQTIGDVITAGRDDEFQNPSEVENLIKQALEAVNRMQGTSDAAIAAAKEAKDSQDAAKVSEDNAKSSEESAATSAAQALGSQTAAKTSEDNAKKSEDASAAAEQRTLDAEGRVKESESNAKRSEENARTSELAAKEARDQIEEFGVADGSVTDEKLSPELREKIDGGGGKAEHFGAAFDGFTRGLSSDKEGYVKLNDLTKISGDEFPSWCGVAPNGGSLYLMDGIYTVSIFPTRKTQKVDGDRNIALVGRSFTIQCLTFPNWDDFDSHDMSRIFTAQDEGVVYPTGRGQWSDHRIVSSLTLRGTDATRAIFVKTRMNLHFSGLLNDVKTSSVSFGVSIIKHA